MNIYKHLLQRGNTRERARTSAHAIYTRFFLMPTRPSGSSPPLPRIIQYISFLLLGVRVKNMWIHYHTEDYITLAAREDKFWLILLVYDQQLLIFTTGSYFVIKYFLLFTCYGEKHAENDNPVTSLVYY